MNINFNQDEVEPKKVSILESIIKMKPGAPRITLYGKPGVGKTTLAASFPEPLFLLTEDPECPDINALPIFTSYDELFNAVNELLAVPDLPFKTIVIDSISKLDTIVTQYTLKKSPPIYCKETKKQRDAQTLSESWGGYGSGFEKAASLHRALKARMDKFKERGIGVIYIAHVEIKKYKSPETEDYDIISVAMNNDKSRACYIDDVDAVLYCKNKSFTVDLDTPIKGKKKTVVKSTGTHIIVPISNDVHVSKNRYSMPPEMPMTYEAIAQHIPFFKGLNNE